VGVKTQKIGQVEGKAIDLELSMFVLLVFEILRLDKIFCKSLDKNSQIIF
jgi:hypothetical protein